jgi:hypothetical protein
MPHHGLHACGSMRWVGLSQSESTSTMTEGGNVNHSNGGWLTRNGNLRKRRLPIEGEGGRDHQNQNASPGSSIVAAMTTTTTDDHGSSIDKLLPLPDSIHSIPSSSPSPSGIPASLAPYLGWTKLSTSASCRRRRIQQRQLDLQRARKLMALSELENDDDGEEEGVYRKVDGHAIVSVSIT